MAGAAFSPSSFNAVAGVPKPGKPTGPKPKGLGATLAGLHNPLQHPGATMTFNPPSRQTAPAPTPPKASGTTTTPAQSPLDSTYYQQVAANQFKLNNQINSLGAQSQNDTTALQNALAQLAYQQPRDSLKLEQAANNRGALYSSPYTQDLGNLNNTYQTRQSADVQANAQKQAAIQAQIAALQQGEPIAEAGFYDDAVARAAKAAAANPATGQPTVPSPTPPKPTRPSVPKGALRKNGTLNVNIPIVRNGFGYKGGF